MVLETLRQVPVPHLAFRNLTDSIHVLVSV